MKNNKQKLIRIDPIDLEKTTIKFARCNAWNAILREKKILKSKSVTIMDNLTKNKIEIKIAPQIYSFENVSS